jgi:hypothetical protein
MVHALATVADDVVLDGYTWRVRFCVTHKIYVGWCDELELTATGKTEAAMITCMLREMELLRGFPERASG